MTTDDNTSYPDLSNIITMYNSSHTVTTISPNIGGAAYVEAETPLKHFSKVYQGVHGYVSILVCVMGIASNVMNIVVLTRRNMVSSTNYMLTAIATADMLTMSSYLPYALYFYCISTPEEQGGHGRGWVIYLLFHTNFIITFHTIAMWLTVALAIFRYIVVCHHTLGPKLCNLYRAKVTVLSVVVSTILCCVPNYVMYVPQYSNSTQTWWFNFAPYVQPFHIKFNFWLFGVVLKVAPCVLLAVLSSLLIHAMHLANKKRKRLKSQGKRAECERASEHNRTTAMLVAVVLCFVITELPQGILAFLSGVDNNFFNNVYVPLGDVWDITVLVNSSVNFILYCIMSRQFRETFNDVFLKYCQVKSRPPKTPNGCEYKSIKTYATKV